MLERPFGESARLADPDVLVDQAVPSPHATPPLDVALHASKWRGGFQVRLGVSDDPRPEAVRSKTSLREPI
jgi:hypothetical protein